MIALPPVIGHRGAAALAPENTLAGIRAAKAAGARWVEFDIRLTRDGALVLLHDDTLKRTAGLRRRLESLTLTDLEQLDAGSWFSPEFAGEPIPTLESALSLLAELALGANIEIKPDPGRARPLARALIDTLNAASHGRGVPVLISSLDERMLREVRRIDPDIPLAIVLRRRRRVWPDLASRLGCFSIHCRNSWIRPRDVERIQETGMEALVFTVNDPERAAELLGWGVRGVFSDTPDKLLAANIGSAAHQAS